ncbi:MAG: zf-HC2 domain-containing protein [Candidatus Dormibacteria bacterium]
MRCSLLTLSGYLDDELNAEKRAAVDAHLVGCSRCRNGLGHLEEEVARVHHLPRLHVADHSVHALLEQMGLVGSDDLLPSRLGRVALQAHAGTPPWLLTGVTSAALPWLPRKHKDDGVDLNQPALPFADVPLDQIPQPRVAMAAHPDGEPEVELNGRTVVEETHPTEESKGHHIVDTPPMEEIIEPPWTDFAADGPPTSPGIDPPLPDPPTAADPEPLPLVAEMEAMHPPAGASPPDAAAPSTLEETPMAPPDHSSPESPAPLARSPWHGNDEIDDDAFGWAPRDGNAPGRSPLPPAAAEPERESEPEPEPLQVQEAPAIGVAAHVPSAVDHVPDRLVATPRPVRPPLWTRIRDQLALRLALARPQGEDDSLQIVSGIGAPLREGGMRRPSRRVPGSTLSSTAAASAISPPHPSPHIGPVPTEPDFDDSLPDVAAPAAGSVHGVAEADPPVSHEAQPFDDSPDSGMPAATVAIPAEGRHARSLRRAKGISIGAAARPALAGFSRRVREVLVHPRQRWYAAAGIVALLLVAVFELGSGRSPASPARSQAGAPARSQAGAPASVPAAVPPSATAATAPPPVASSAPASPAPASAAPSAASPPGAVVLGDGGTGWQVQGVRYGAHPGSLRLVFDMTAAGGSATGAPKVTITFPTATTMQVSFEKTVASGSPGQAPPGGVVTAATLVSPPPTAGSAVYRYTVSRPVTPHAQYVTGGLRLVIDLA